MLTVFAENAGAAQAPTTMEMLSTFLPFIVIIVAFYFLMLRPQKKRDKENREMLASIKVGDTITTIGGMVGKIVKIKDEKVTFETGPKAEASKITIERWAIKSVQKEVSADE